jgi:hypothetical protein
MDFDKLVFTIGDPKPGRGRIVYAKNADGTDANFQAGEWTADLASNDPEVRNAAIAKLPHVRSHFHQKREMTDKETGATKILDSQTIEIQLSSDEIAALHRLHERYVRFCFDNQDKLWPRKDPSKEKLADIEIVRERVGRLAKVSNDGTSHEYLHIKVHYPFLAGGNGLTINPRAKHSVLLQNPKNLSEMYEGTIEQIMRNMPCVFTGAIRGFCVMGSKLVHPTADLLMFGGCAFDPNAGARDPSLFTSFGMTISRAPLISAVVDNQSMVGGYGENEGEVAMEDVTSNNF